jgi:hypothetical protein
MPIQPVGAKQEPELVVFKSLQKSPQRERILLLGAPTDGKTTCALTASPKFDPTKRGDGVVIDDICPITVDSAALNYARALGYEFAYWLDLSEHLNKSISEFNKITEKFLATANKLVLEGKTHTTIFDNFSTVDGFWRGELAKNFEGWPLQDKMDLEHKRLLLERIMPTAGNMILIAHTKTVGKMDEDKRESLGIEAGTKLVMDISSWNAPKMYRAQTSQRIPIKKIQGRTMAQDQYNLYPRGVDGIEYGGRYPQLSAHDKLPANMQVVFQLIKESAGAVVARA